MATGAPESTREENKEVARIAAFSDGVFAIAITLLTLQLQLPAHVDLGKALIDIIPGLFGFVVSFLVIGTYWVAHHRLFSVVTRYDGVLIWLNMAELFFIVLLPFTTTVIADHGDEPLGVIVYALSVACVGFANTGLAAYALVGHRLCHESLSQSRISYSLWRGGAVAVYFVASLVLLPLGTQVVTYSWLGIAVLTHLLRRHYRSV